MGATRYARCGNLDLAYQVVGDGPIDLLVVPPFVSHLEMWWTVPQTAAWLNRLSSFARLILFDKAGTGLSDPVPSIATLEERAQEIDAVLDAAGSERASVLGVSEGGPAAVLYATSRPARVRDLVLFGSFASLLAGSVTSEDVLEEDPASVRERLETFTEERYVPRTEQLDRLLHFGRLVRDQWGDGSALVEMAPSAAPMREQLGLVERVSASPGMARASLESALRIDVRTLLPALDVPTLVLHARDDLIPLPCAWYLTDHIPGAQLVELDGDDHPPWFGDVNRSLEAIERFLTGRRAQQASERLLTTVLFTDIVGSTERAAAMGDERWRFVLERCDSITQEQAAAFGGRVVKSLGDGHLLTFPGPARAIRCAEVIQTDLARLDVPVRAGVHTGECEVLGDDIGGMAVHIGARISALAGAGEIFVSSTVRDLVVGSGLAFTPRGDFELKGVPGTWTILSVSPPEGTVDASLAAQPTPSTNAYLTRQDRLVLTLARRAPRVALRVASAQLRRLGVETDPTQPPSRLA